jgi:hypothetical protein
VYGYIQRSRLDDPSTSVLSAAASTSTSDCINQSGFKGRPQWRVDARRLSLRWPQTVEGQSWWLARAGARCTGDILAITMMLPPLCATRKVTLVSSPKPSSPRWTTSKLLCPMCDWHHHYGKLRLCRAYTALPRAFCRALGRVNLCRAPPSAQVNSRHNHLCRRPDRRHSTTLGKPNSLPRVSSRDRTARRRRTDGRHI